MTTQPILVTGAAGFIGARFVESCNERGQAVIASDAAAHFAEREELRGLDFGLVVDRDELLGALRSAAVRPAAVVHLGACTDTAELDVAYLTRVNVDYSRALCAWARDHGVPFVYASSAATYGGGEHGYGDDEAGMRELAPLNPYGDSKLQFDLWMLAEEAAGRLPAHWSGFKFFNVYGYGERHKGAMQSVVVQAFDQIRATGRVRLFRSHRDGIADGEQQRDFVWVGDVVDVLHFALDEPLRRGIYNLGTGSARTFLDLVRAVFAALDLEPRIEFVDTPQHLRARYQYFTQAEMGKLRAAGYDRPFTTLEDGVARTVERLLVAEASSRA